MNAVDELRLYIENRGEQMISLGNGQYVHDHMLPAILEDIEREYVELPKDADGVPIKPGDKVLTPGGDTVTVKFVGKGDGVIDGVCYCRKGTGHTWDEARKCHHVKPDSWEQIEADACKNYMNYFGCSGFACADCPSKIDGVKPYSRYETDSCELAMRLDIVRRCKALSEMGA